MRPIINRHAAWPLVVAIAAALSAPGCSSGTDTGEGVRHPGARAVEVVITEAGLSPAQICAAPGSRVQVLVRNDTKSRHSLEFDLAGSSATLGKDLAPGESAEMTLVVPSKPGKYPFYSPFADEHSKGFTGVLVVTEPGVMRPVPMPRIRPEPGARAKLRDP